MKHLSYTRGRQDIPLLTRTIGSMLDETVARFPDREALISLHQGLRFSWTELAAEVDILARALMAIGLKTGDRFGIWMPNYAEWCFLQFAAAKVGIVLVNINPAYRLSELEYTLKQSGCNWLVCVDTFRTSDYHAMLNQLVPELAETEPGALFSETLPELRGIISFSTNPPSGFLSWASLLEFAEYTNPEALRERQESLQFDDPINIQYTSGTTGFPKGATLSHYNILNNGYMVGISLGLTENDRMVIPVPLYHCFGMVMANLACLSHGATMIYPNASFDPLLTLDAVTKEKGTVLYGVPTMFIAELDHPQRGDFDLSTLRTGIMAGSNCPIETMRRVIDEMHMKEVQIAYGMTETSPVSTQTGPDDDLELRVTTVGRTQPQLETKIIDEDGRIVPRGEVGELCTRGYSVMLGYWNDLGSTREVIDAAHWMHTGDLGSMDEDGYVRIIGRSKDMIIRGGENIYPREIEEFLITHPDISEAHVVGVPDIKYGEEVVAWVRPRAGRALDEETLRLWCRERIAHFKVPRHFHFVKRFPMTVTGKAQKFRMRKISKRSLR
ncbi:MAG: AMP-binding protein [Xanthomonadaceae bacterium]|jgi:fatty-acyl-CoA synthase|nr:AMP-binding protein [Xanthomonadaceae bacterium]